MEVYLEVREDGGFLCKIFGGFFASVLEAGTAVGEEDA
jgi:hypothetical protein